MVAAEHKVKLGTKQSNSAPKWGGHSLRRGGALFAALQGVSVEDIKHMDGTMWTPLLYQAVSGLWQLLGRAAS
eukprot:6216547-Amphidinium_carterae.1